MRCVCFAIWFPVLSLLMGCTYSPYVDGYLYMPRPAVSQVPASQPSQPPPVSAYASVIGVRWQDRSTSLPECIEVRLRVDSNGPQAVTFDPRYMLMSTGDLVQFPAAITQGSPAATLQPGESTIATAFFPFPGDRSYGEFDLRTLQLRWYLYIGQQRVEQIADFQQVYPSYYYNSYGPYWGPYPYAYGGPVFVGGVVIHGRR